MNEQAPSPSPRLGWVGLLALLGVVLAGVVLVYQVIGVVVAARVPSAQEQRSANKDKELDEGYREAFSAYLPQIKGRSLFFVPAPPSVAQASEPEDEGPAPDPPKPSTYGGPKIVAMINDEVWLEDKKRLSVGQSAGGDVKLVSLTAPWSARLEWRGVEFEVPFLKRDSVVLPDAKEPSATPAPEPSDPAETPSDSAEPSPKPEEAPSPSVDPSVTPSAAPGEGTAVPPAPPPPAAPPASGATPPTNQARGTQE